MSYDRREFLKTLTLGGVALFTADWFKLVEETKAASAGKLLPAWPGEKVSAKGDQIRAFWNDSEGYFELCLNGTIYDEVPDLEDDDEDEFDSSELEQGEDESEEEFEERVEEAREEWESENGSSRERRQENHEFDWYRRSCPGAKAGSTGRFCNCTPGRGRSGRSAGGCSTGGSRRWSRPPSRCGCSASARTSGWPS